MITGLMETLTAFVRERTTRTEAEQASKPLNQRRAARAYFLWEHAGRPEGRSEEFWAKAGDILKELFTREHLGEPPGTDIAAVLTGTARLSLDYTAGERQNIDLEDRFWSELRLALTLALLLLRACRFSYSSQFHLAAD